MMTLRKILIAALMAVSFCFPSVAFAETPEEFAKAASLANNFQISVGNLAAQTSQDVKVKASGQQIAGIHTGLAASLKSVMTASKLTVPQETQLNAKHQALYDDLKKSSGADFDAKYWATEEKFLNDLIPLYKNYAANGSQEYLKTFASSALSALEGEQETMNSLHPKK